MANLDPGAYQLSARRDGFAHAQLGRDGKKSEPIVLAKGDFKTGLLVKMIPYGAIAGRLAMRMAIRFKPSTWLC